MCNMIASEREKEIACVCVCVSVIREEVSQINIFESDNRNQWRGGSLGRICPFHIHLKTKAKGFSPFP